MTAPTREQVIEWAQTTDPGIFYPDINLYDDDINFLIAFATLAMSSGRKQGLREAKEVCERERVEDTGTEGDVAYNMAVGHCAAAIEQLRGK